MILTPTQAREAGEALIDAAEDAINKEEDQKVIWTKDVAVSVPATPDLTDDFEQIAYIKV